jgi:hypothetical protein
MNPLKIKQQLCTRIYKGAGAVKLNAEAAAVLSERLLDAGWETELKTAMALLVV